MYLDTATCGQHSQLNKQFDTSKRATPFGVALFVLRTISYALMMTALTMNSTAHNTTPVMMAFLWLS